MADYNASELVSSVDMGPVAGNMSAIGGNVSVSPGDLGTVLGAPVPISARDLIEIRPTLYRLRGYYVGGSTYEFWTGVSIDTPNPSGNPLINKVVDSVLS